MAFNWLKGIARKLIIPPVLLASSVLPSHEAKGGSFFSFYYSNFTAGSPMIYRHPGIYSPWFSGYPLLYGYPGFRSSLFLGSYYPQPIPEGHQEQESKPEPESRKRRRPSWRSDFSYLKEAPPATQSNMEQLQSSEQLQPVQPGQMTQPPAQTVAPAQPAPSQQLIQTPPVPRPEAQPAKAQEGAAVPCAPAKQKGPDMIFPYDRTGRICDVQFDDTAIRFYEAVLKRAGMEGRQLAVSDYGKKGILFVGEGPYRYAAIIIKEREISKDGKGRVTSEGFVDYLWRKLEPEWGKLRSQGAVTGDFKNVRGEFTIGYFPTHSCEQ